ncbi:ribonuclease H protein, partial [Trifolium medium]|nr:ribonuclease H protein [Trifolium medium]
MTNLSGYTLLQAYSPLKTLTYFCILKAFNIKINPPKAPDIIEVLWQPPILHWFKCNTDGAALG